MDNYPVLAVNETILNVTKCPPREGSVGETAIVLLSLSLSVSCSFSLSLPLSFFFPPTVSYLSGCVCTIKRERERE